MPADVLTWGAAISAIAALLAVGKMFVDAGVTKQKAAAAERSAHEAHQRIDALAAASRDFVTAAALAAALDPLRNDIRQVNLRLDNVLGQLANLSTRT